MRHWRETDYRIATLKETIKGLQDTFEKVESENNLVYYFDGGFTHEESSLIIGLCFVAIQNYIHSTINDLLPEKPKYLYYNFECAEKYGSKIDLIISLANLTKHKESESNTNPEIIKYTKLRLETFKLSYDDTLSDTLHAGLKILDERKNLLNILEIIYTWRVKLIDAYKRQM